MSLKSGTKTETVCCHELCRMSLTKHVIPQKFTKIKIRPKKSKNLGAAWTFRGPLLEKMETNSPTVNVNPIFGLCRMRAASCAKFFACNGLLWGCHVTLGGKFDFWKGINGLIVFAFPEIYVARFCMPGAGAVSGANSWFQNLQALQH